LKDIDMTAISHLHAKPQLRRLILTCVSAFTLILPGVSAARAADISVAVAANFTAPAKELAAAFHAQTGDTLALSFGSSGQFYAQIAQGAPYEVFLSADAVRPQKAVAAGLAVSGTVFTYAIGKLVLWSADPRLVDPKGEVLIKGNFIHLANADPAAAPYGAAGEQVMKALGVYSKIEPKIVTGQSITQTYQFVASGNAELGFVAMSQVMKGIKGSRWIVPQNLYAPIVQDAVLLKPGADDAGAKAFLEFLKTAAASKIIQSYGYAMPGN
jgi:molybdate transport system substrate-binding protein